MIALLNFVAFCNGTDNIGGFQSIPSSSIDKLGLVGGTYNNKLANGKLVQFGATYRDS